MRVKLDKPMNLKDILNQLVKTYRETGIIDYSVFKSENEKEQFVLFLNSPENE